MRPLICFVTAFFAKSAALVSIVLKICKHEVVIVKLGEGVLGRCGVACRSKLGRALVLQGFASDGNGQTAIVGMIVILASVEFSGSMQTLGEAVAY
ncbi:predicted protein [Plenodomus lingam JN3]|uniref:Uncharacterized protein n=1 Tax=Leptosphaeria maculans (strain JN3 / isolate v23.1.3 / race Av1-4-5-6-7-8) TaxID=985895 RepID=M1ZJE1_LEPMJ|nr:predicted protein [Plenodomus lingam JN3]